MSECDNDRTVPSIENRLLRHSLREKLLEPVLAVRLPDPPVVQTLPVMEPVDPITLCFDELIIGRPLDIKTTFLILTSDPSSSDLPVMNDQNLSVLQPRNKCCSSYFG